MGAVFPTSSWDFCNQLEMMFGTDSEGKDDEQLPLHPLFNHHFIHSHIQNTVSVGEPDFQTQPDAEDDEDDKGSSQNEHEEEQQEDVHVADVKTCEEALLHVRINPYRTYG